MKPPANHVNAVRFHRGMAGLVRAAGFENLSRSHEIATVDCPPHCPCEGCERGREEQAERREQRHRQPERRAP